LLSYETFLTTSILASDKTTNSVSTNVPKSIFCKLANLARPYVLAGMKKEGEGEMGFLAADLFDRGRHICMGLPVS